VLLIIGLTGRFEAVYLAAVLSLMQVVHFRLGNGTGYERRDQQVAISHTARPAPRTRGGANMELSGAVKKSHRFRKAVVGNGTTIEALAVLPKRHRAGGKRMVVMF